MRHLVVDTLRSLNSNSVKQNTTAVNISSVKQTGVLLKHLVISRDVPAALRERTRDHPSEELNRTGAIGSLRNCHMRIIYVSN